MSQEKATPQASVDVVSSSVEPHPGHGPLLDNTFQTGVHPTDGKSVAADVRAVPVPTTESSSEETVDLHIDPDRIIITGTDAANHLLSLRDDFDPAITFRGMFLGTILSAFQAVMYQIYLYKPTQVTISGTFIVLIAYFLGKGWAFFLPRGDRQLASWRSKGGQGEPPLWIKAILFINPGPWGLKEHAICAITATAASNGAAAVSVFAAQDLFYSLPISTTTVILSLLSIGLFGYGLSGLLRPIAVWQVDAVYWSTLPTVKTLQGLHWQEVKNSKPLRWFWYAFAGMFFYEFFPAYIFPWLNSVSIPCLASMKATGSTAALLETLFGGATNNEGLGIFSLSFDWQYITSSQTSYPLSLQVHSAIGFFVCFIVMLGIYYSNAWNSRSLPFMSTTLKSHSGKSYPVAKVFKGGVLDKAALEQYGIPRLSGSFAYALFIANAAIGALVAHTALFWGGDIKRSYRSMKSGKYDDPHHAHMVKHYKEVPWLWYISILVVAFIFGLVVVLKEDLTLPVWAYITSLILGIVIAPFSSLLYARFGNGIATNNLSKMIAGLLLPGRPVGNMYFAAWSHSVISNCINLCNDLKMGEYLKIAPRAMFATQIYGTVLGGFVNYGIMKSVVKNNRDLLANNNGDSTWSGAYIQSYNTNAASWALAKYLYTSGNTYEIVPLGIFIGAGVVILHRVFVHFFPKIKNLNTRDINIPQFIQYAGYIPYNQSQTCVIFSQIIAGFYTQFYLRNYKPRIFKDYMYLVTGAMDGGSLLALFVLSMAVFGVAGRSVSFPTWWGNNGSGNYDWCPSAS